MMVGQIPTMVDSAAKAISNIKLDKVVVVWDGGDGGTAGFVQNMVRALPPMMSVIEEVGGMKLPGFVGTRIETPVTAEGNGASAAHAVPEDRIKPAGEAAP